VKAGLTNNADREHVLIILPGHGVRVSTYGLYMAVKNPLTKYQVERSIFAYVLSAYRYFRIWGR
jgi:hypothetical protein